jgi:hypothetical protein
MIASGTTLIKRTKFAAIALLLLALVFGFKFVGRVMNHKDWNLSSSHTFDDVGCSLPAREYNELIAFGEGHDLTLRLPGRQPLKIYADQIYIRRDGLTNDLYKVEVRTEELTLQQATAQACEIAQTFGMDVSKIKDWAAHTAQSRGFVPNLEVHMNKDLPNYSLSIQRTFDDVVPWRVSFTAYWGNAEQL